MARARQAVPHRRAGGERHLVLGRAPARGTRRGSRVVRVVPVRPGSEGGAVNTADDEANCEHLLRFVPRRPRRETAVCVLSVTVSTEVGDEPERGEWFAE